MSRLIKSLAPSEQSRIRALGQAGGGDRKVETEEERERAAAARCMAALEAQLAARDEEILRLREEVAEARREGEASGRELGRSEADVAVERRLAILAAATEQALSLYAAELSALERLAPLLARRAVEKILGDAERHAELLAAALHRQLRELEVGAIVHIEVSAHDFPDADALGALQKAASSAAGLEILALPYLEAGACRVKLRLGGLDVGLGQQWSRLSNMLDRAAEPPEGSA